MIKVEIDRRIITENTIRRLPYPFLKPKCMSYCHEHKITTMGKVKGKYDLNEISTLESKYKIAI